jgi:hypothetical protein
MSARIVNLRTRRKQKARDARLGESSGTAPGVSRSERDRAGAENRRDRERLEGHRLEGREPDGPAPDEG